MLSPGDAPTALDVALRVLRRQGLVMAAFFLAVLGVTAAATLLLPRAYRSQARVLLRLGRENTTLDPTVSPGQTVVTVPGTRDLELNTALEIVTSRELADKVIAAFGPAAILGKGPPEEVDDPDAPRSEAWQLALEAYRKNLSAEVVKKSSVLAVSYDASGPDLAQEIVAKLTRLFQDRHIEMHHTPGGHAFLSGQSSRLEEKVKATEDDLRRKKADTGLASPEAQRQLLATRLGRLEDELGQAKASLAAADAEVDHLGRVLEKTDPTQATATTRGMPNQGADLIRSQLAQLRGKEADLTGRHGETHPEVRLIRQQLRAVEAALRQEDAGREQVTTGPNKVYEEAQLALMRQRSAAAALRAREAGLREQLRLERERLAGFAAAELEVGRLQRRLDIETAQLKRYAEGMEQSRVDAALQAEKISNVSVIQPATFEPKAVRPKLSTNLMIGSGLGLVGAAGLGLLLDLRSRRREPRP